MSTMTTVAATEPETRATPAPAPSSIPLSRLVSVELTKMFNTRSGFWLMASIGITALLATTAVIVFAPDDQLTFDTFAAAIGFPMAVILPMVAILSVTSEWSQRSGLTTFTLVPHRSRVIGAKLVATVGIGVVSMGLALAIGALGNLVGTAITGTDVVWDITAGHFGLIVLGNVLGMMLGFGLGVLLRNSAGAIVAYFVYALVLPSLAGLLAAYQGWFRDLQGWIDFNFAQSALFDGSLTGAQWAHLGTASLIWLVVPLSVGVWLVLRSEVK